MPETVRRVLWILVAASLLPAALLVAERLAVEHGSRRVAIVMDVEALEAQAHALAVDPFELALDYRELGLSGIALYEQTPESLAEDGRIAAIPARDAAARLALAGEPVPEDLPTPATLVRELEAGAADALLAKAARPPAGVELGGATWWAFPGDVMETQPGGPDREELRRYLDAGFDVAYRPRDAPGLRHVGEDFPDEARYLVHAGLDLAGHPHALSDLVEASQGHLTAIIEGTPQHGFAEIRGRVPTVRLLSFNQDYVNRQLEPQELIDKYLLAANERNVRLLYLRPYTEEQLGDMRANTEALVAGLRRALEADGFVVEPLPTTEAELEGYAPSAALRALAGVGVLAGLALLAGLYPGAWGVAAAAAVGLLGLAAGGLDWDALALVAALVFPVLGYGFFGDRRQGWLLATGVSLVGATLLVAVGSDRASVLGLAPFRGVAATLVVPPALYLAHALLRERGPAAWLRTLWRQPIRVGPVAVALVGVAALALVVIRRGNTPIIGASELELRVREALSSWFARPRFKELLGHPLGVLGLADGGWPAWVRAPLLTGGVIAQASVLNSFSHYHTPLLVSLERTIVALVLGVAIGLVLVGVARVAVPLVGRWLRAADA